MTEIWKPVLGFEGNYEVSSLGRVRAVERKVWFTSKTGGRHLRTKRPKIMAQRDNGTGYLLVWLNHDDNKKAKTVHSLVAEAFIGPRPPKHDVCHNDGNRTNNRADNLRWDTRSNNHRDRIAHGTIYKNIGTAILNPKLVVEIRDMQHKTSAKLLASRYGVAKDTIRKIWAREAWKYVR